jgi:hypothetical protein
VLRFIRNLKDKISTKNANLLIAIDSRNFSEKEYSLIEDELEEFKK